MKTIETKVYTIDELSDKAKEKAREWYKSGDDMPFLSEYLSEKLAELLKENGITYRDIPKVFYSLSYCQGDGAMFEGVVFWGDYTAKIKQSGHYYHYNSKAIDLLISDGYDEAPDDKQKEFNEIYIDICRTLEKAGYAYIDDENSNENVDENIRANEYTFTESGKRFG